MITHMHKLPKQLSFLLFILISMTLFNQAHAASYEAEKAAINGAKIRSGANGLRYVDYTAANQNITFTVNVAKAGTYSLNITQANGRGWKTGVNIFINNKFSSTNWLSPTGGWAKWKTSAVKVNLFKGNNKIRLTAKYDHSQNIDKVSVPAAISATNTTNNTTTSASSVLEAESAWVSGAKKRSSNTASKQVYVDFTATGQFIEFSYNAPSAGTYTMKTTAANGRTQTTGIDILVNSKLAVTDWMKSSGGWTKWVTDQVNLQLKAGTNKIRLKAKYSHSQNIDKIQLAKNTTSTTTSTSSNDQTGSTGATSGNSTSYEAENANLFGASKRSANNASNGQYADFTAANQSIVFNINATAAGNYKLNITEANGRTYSTGMDVSVNGKLSGTEWLDPTSGWTSWRTNSLSIKLNKGSNSIKLKSRYDHSQNVDKITISGGNTTTASTNNNTQTTNNGSTSSDTNTTTTVTPRNTTSGNGGMRIGTNVNFQNPHANKGRYNGVSAFKDNINWQTTTNPWNSQFLTDMKIYSVIRFMNWSGTNKSTESNWNSRVKKTDYGQDQHWDGIKPVSWEWMIDLSNRLGADMWVNLPHPVVNRNSGKSGNLPNDYARKLAILIKYGVDMQNINLASLVNGNYSLLAGKNKQWYLNQGGVATGPALNPGLNVYVEYSNEVWNLSSSFTQSRYAGNEAAAIGIPAAPSTKPNNENLELIYKFSAYAHTLVWNSFEDVYGSDARVKKVLGHQNGNSYHLKFKYEIMNNPSWNPKRTKPDSVAVNTYFGGGRNGSNGTIWTQLQTDINTLMNRTRDFKNETQSLYGVKTISYEGGQHVTKNCAGINKNNEMYKKYQNYLNQLSNEIGLLMHYTHAGGYQDNSNCWGSVERLGETNSPKYRALKEFIQ